MADTTKPILYYRRLLEAFDDEDDRVETLASMFHCARGCGDDETAAVCALRLGRLLASTDSLVTALEHFKIALRHAPRPLPAGYAVEFAGTRSGLVRTARPRAFCRRSCAAQLPGPMRSRSPSS